jgi:hypothetical protein
MSSPGWGLERPYVASALPTAGSAASFCGPNPVSAADMQLLSRVLLRQRAGMLARSDQPYPASGGLGFSSR